MPSEAYIGSRLGTIHTGKGMCCGTIVSWLDSDVALSVELTLCVHVAATGRRSSQGHASMGSHSISVLTISFTVTLHSGTQSSAKHIGNPALRIHTV